MTTNTFDTNMTTTFSSSADWYGMKCYCNNSNIKITAVTKDSDCAHTKCAIYTTDGTNTKLAEATFSSNVATFNLEISSGVSYAVVCHSDGSTANSVRNNSPSFPYNNTDLNGTQRCYVNGGTYYDYGTTSAINILSVTTESTITNITVQPTALALSTDQPIINVKIHAQPLDIGAIMSAIQPIMTIVYPQWTSGTRGINTKYPFTSGLTARTTSQTGHVENLIPQKSYLNKKW